jgi:hypothetical protein
MWRLALVMVAACGRVGFDARDDAGSSPIHHAGVFAERDPGVAQTDTFTAQTVDGNTIVLMVGCIANTAPTSYAVAAPGMVFTTLIPGFGSDSDANHAQVFTAVAHTSNSTSITVDVSGGPCSDLIVLADAFSIDQGTLGFDAMLGKSGMGAPCQGSVITGSPNEVVWAACHSSTDLVAVGPGFMKAADDAFGDWSEFKVSTDAVNTTEDAGFSASSGNYALAMVTLKAQ